MGYGDELMVTGQVRQMHERDGRRVRVIYRGGVIRWHELWDHNPRFARPHELGNFPLLINGPGERPYIADKATERWTWKEWECPRGEIYLSGPEREIAARHTGRVIFEPHNKPRASPNKEWGWVRWSKLAYFARKAGIRVTQLGPLGTQLLEGAEHIVTNGFREACAVIAEARACVLPEGGLHHAAAAFNRPAVVIFGGFISPRQTGYEGHVNLFTGAEPCGMRKPCMHCQQAMAAITPESVFDHLIGVMNDSGNEAGRRGMAAGA